MTARRTRRWLPVALAVAVAATAALAALSWSRSATNTVGTVEFGRPLAIPPLAPSHVDDQGRRVFDLTLQRGSTDFGQAAPTPTWGINGSYLGPTLRAARGETVLINVHNEVGEATTLHWHGMHLPARMDGGPHQMIEPGSTWSPTWTISQPAATLWYHPHLHGRTAEHVARGLAGMFIVDDDPRPGELPLPRDYGVDDVPVMVQDRSFRSDGRFDDRDQALSNTGLLGDTILVNGTVNPSFQVTTQRVRLRLLNASNARIYNFGFDDDRPFAVIGTDGGLLASPSQLRRIQLSPGERAEIVITVRPGERPVLRSFAPELGAGFLATRLAGGDDAFDVLELLPAQHLSASMPVPDRLVELPDPDPSSAVTTRTFRLGDSQINGQTMDMARVDLVATVGTSEIWQVTNADGSPHSFHVHDVQFRIVDRDGKPPPAELAGRKDTVYVAPETSVRLLLAFTDHTDPQWPYMFHCHLLRHEDQGMMGQFVVVRPGEAAATQLGTTPEDSPDGMSEPMSGHHH